MIFGLASASWLYSARGKYSSNTSSCSRPWSLCSLDFCQPVLFRNYWGNTQLTMEVQIPRCNWYFKGKGDRRLLQSFYTLSHKPSFTPLIDPISSMRPHLNPSLSHTQNSVAIGICCVSKSICKHIKCTCRSAWAAEGGEKEWLTAWNITLNSDHVL